MVGCLLGHSWAAGLHSNFSLCKGTLSSSSENLGTAASPCLVLSRCVVSHSALVCFLRKRLGAEKAYVGLWGLLCDRNIRSVNLSL